MQIRRARITPEWEWFWLTIRGERFVSFFTDALSLPLDGYRIAAVNFRVLTSVRSSGDDFHIRPRLSFPWWNLLTPIKHACVRFVKRREKILLSIYPRISNLHVRFNLTTRAWTPLSTESTSIESSFVLALTVTELSSRFSPLYVSAHL